MKLNYIVKDIVDVVKEDKDVAFATTADFAMGSGVARTLNKEFDLKLKFKDKYDRYFPDAGDVYPLENLIGQQIYALIDKRTRYDSVDLNNLEKCFVALRSAMMFIGKHEIYIPKIGAGADKLSWTDEVLPVLNKIFTSDVFTINVCVLNDSEIPSDETFDIVEDEAEGVVDITKDDLLNNTDNYNNITVSRNVFDDYVEDGEIDIRIMDSEDNSIHTYKMILQWDDGIMMNKVD